MSDLFSEALSCRPEELCRALPIHASVITDSCRDSDCIEDLRVWLTASGQQALSSATAVKVRSAQLLHTALGVTPVAFDSLRYSVDLTFYYRIGAEALTPGGRPTSLTGLSVFSKQAILRGLEGAPHCFSSLPGGGDPMGPTALIQVLDPIVLGSRVAGIPVDAPPLQLPQPICDQFDEPLCLTPTGSQLLITLGQYSILRLEQQTQLLLPVLDCAIPTRDCRDTPDCPEDPCDLFARLPFPAESFCPGLACPAQSSN